MIEWNPEHGYELADGGVVVTHVPGGFWAVKVRPGVEGFIVFGWPRKGTVEEPFTIATATERPEAVAAAVEWHRQAQTLTMRLDRVVFAGFGDATEETELSGVPAWRP